MVKMGAQKFQHCPTFPVQTGLVTSVYDYPYLKESMNKVTDEAKEGYLE